MIRLSIILGLLVGYYFSLNAQTDFPFQRTYTTKDGLSHNDVRCIAQDHFGFLWIGTWDGLCRYDGFEFKRYFSNPNDPYSLPYSQICDLAIDKNNDVWIVGQTLSRFDRDSERFLKFRGWEAFTQRTGVSQIKTDTNENIFISSANSIYTYAYSTDSLEEVIIVDSANNKTRISFNLFNIDRDNYFWLINTYSKDIIKLKYKQDLQGRKNHCLQILRSYRSDCPGPDSPSFLLQFWVYPTENDRIWIMSNDGLLLKHQGSGFFSKASPGEIMPMEFSGYKPLMWSDRNDGLYVIFPDKNLIKYIPSSEIMRPQSFLCDMAGNIWCGNLNRNDHGAGLHQFIYHFTGFKYYPDPSMNEYRDLAVFSIYQEDNQDLFLGVKNFPYILQIKHDGRIEKTNSISLKANKNLHYPRAFLKDNRARLWVGYLQHILRRYNSETRIFEDINHFPGIQFSKSSFPSFRTMALCKNGLIVTGGFGCLLLFSPDSNRIVNFLTVLHDLYSAYCDSLNRIWIGGSGILYCYDQLLNPLDSFRIQKIGYNIESIEPDDTCHLWLGMQMGGLCRLNLITRETEFYTQSNGLANSTVYNILKDNSGKLWVSTDDGISVFNPLTQRFFNYDESNGLYIHEFNADAAFLCKDGQMLFGGMGGAVGFYAEKLEQRNQAYETRLVIKQITFQIKKRDSIQAVYDRTKVVFPAGTKNIQISFSYLDFQNQDKTQFRYRLLGLNDSWTELQSRIRTINLMALGYGKYVFELEASDLDGTWTKSARLHVIIPPYLWEIKSIQFLALVVLFLFVGYIAYVRFQQFKLKKNLNMALKDRKISELDLITRKLRLNPHFLANSMVAIKSFIHSGDREKADRYLSGLQEMMRAIIKHDKLEYIPLSDEINQLILYLSAEQIRLDNLFAFEILTEGLVAEHIEIAPSLVLPMAENAIKYAFKGIESKTGHITIKFSLESNFQIMSCYIEDNGVGFQSSQPVKSHQDAEPHGTDMVQKILDYFNTKYKTSCTFQIYEINPGKKLPGVRVIIQIPCKFIA